MEPQIVVALAAIAALTLAMMVMMYVDMRHAQKWRNTMVSADAKAQARRAERETETILLIRAERETWESRALLLDTIRLAIERNEGSVNIYVDGDGSVEGEAIWPEN